MKLLKTSRKFHRWLMLFVGVQFLIWSISGAYMVIFDIDYIHGDSLVVNHQTKVEVSKIGYPLAQLQRRYPDAKDIALEVFIEQPVYRFHENDSQYLVSAVNGTQLSPLSQNEAVRAAKHYYRGHGKVVDVSLITTQPPTELSSRALPAWRVNFEHFSQPSIYVSAQTGKLVGKRHQFWRIFDLMFSFHVMDYQDEDPSNQLLFWVLLFAILAAIFGAILSYLLIFRGSKAHQQAGEL
ncbi:PepSY-associated TM region [Colwellia chukchiensis]|uniref:PepSY-associated TM region n=1 Tax=Colwellia chukchiensis TaxID=641665 RepID=A0A1H7NCC7_9GAMM|nr:PepSY domain-containing protein [Colwellia chukchiensis]SEL21173.1 PepSY-associated TM region [Colwellia chukchiensis]